MDDVITYNNNKCVICKQDDKEGTNLVCIGENGLNTILDYCKRRSNQSLEAYLQTCQHATPNVKVFVLGVCRPDFKNPLRLNHNEVLGIYIHTFGLLGCKHSPVSKKIGGQR